MVVRMMEVKNMVNSQKEIAEMLKRSYDNNRLSHAYLFNGESGTGKKELAYYLALLLYCKNDDKPCLECEECRRILDDSHLNVKVIEKNGQGIKKEQIVALQEEFTKTSLVDGPRVYIIDGIEKISIQAANSLLKFIEEPVNKQTYGIMLCEDINGVLPTIISRCFVVNFKAIEKSRLTLLLKERGIEEKTAILLPYLTNSIDEAIKLANDKNVLRMINLLEEYLQIKNDTMAVVFWKKNQGLLDNADNLRIFFKLIVLAYEDILKLSHKNDKIVITHFNEIYGNIINERDTLKIENDLEIILKTIPRLDSNVSAKNVMHQLMVNLY